ncbi:TPA: biotin/lipoyl-binding protein, partial [Pseudomonas aeruginosa]|nr:biotin/lipoyl-binding protein [Pseudomonas aeruginosa]
MNAHEDKAAMASDGDSGLHALAARRHKRKRLGLLLCGAALGVLAAGWLIAGPFAGTSTDNAYVRGDVTSLAPKVAGYVTALEVGDNQVVRAGDVLFRIDDRDYRARLAQAQANIEAADARLGDVDAQTGLQRALIRQAEAQRRSAVAEMNLAAKTHARSRKLILSNAVSQASVDE